MIHFYLSQFRLSNFTWPKDLALVDNRPCPEAYSALPGSRIARRHCDKDRRRWSGPRVLFSEATKTGPDGHGFGVWYAGICWDIKDIIYIYTEIYSGNISETRGMLRPSATSFLDQPKSLWSVLWHWVLTLTPFGYGSWGQPHWPLWSSHVWSCLIRIQTAKQYWLCQPVPCVSGRFAKWKTVLLPYTKPSARVGSDGERKDLNMFNIPANKINTAASSWSI